MYFHERWFYQRGVFLAASMVLWGFFVITQAQQTIFNVPSTDVLDRDKVYAELDVSFKPTDSAAVDAFSSFVPRLVVGNHFFLFELGYNFN